MDYRKVENDKLGEVVSLNKKIFEGLYPWSPYTEEEYRQKIFNRNPTIFIAEDDGRIIADSISFPKDDKWYIWILAVNVDHRKQGVATELYKMNESYARESGLKVVSIKIYNISSNMLQMALVRGYLIIDIKKDSDPKFNALILELSL